MRNQQVGPVNIDGQNNLIDINQKSAVIDSSSHQSINRGEKLESKSTQEEAELSTQHQHVGTIIIRGTGNNVTMSPVSSHIGIRLTTAIPIMTLILALFLVGMFVLVGKIYIGPVAKLPHQEQLSASAASESGLQLRHPHAEVPDFGTNQIVSDSTLLRSSNGTGATMLAQTPGKHATPSTKPMESISRPTADLIIHGDNGEEIMIEQSGRTIKKLTLSRDDQGYTRKIISLPLGSYQVRCQSSIRKPAHLTGKKLAIVYCQ